MVAAALEAAYAAMLVRGTPAALEPTVMIEPRRRAAIRRPTARLVWNTPVELTAKVSAQSWSVIARAGTGGGCPRR